MFRRGAGSGYNYPLRMMIKHIQYNILYIFLFYYEYSSVNQVFIHILTKH
jgi:hypothetical protein